MVKWLREIVFHMIRGIGLLSLILQKLENIMAAIDDLKAAQAETQAQQTALAASLADLSADVDALIELVNQPDVDLTEVVAQAQAIQAATSALAAAAAEAAAKFPVPTPNPEG